MNATEAIALARLTVRWPGGVTEKIEGPYGRLLLLAEIRRQVPDVVAVVMKITPTAEPVVSPTA